MSRRPATCLQGSLMVALAAVALVACGGADRHEPPAPPPIAASKPATQAPAEQAPAQTTAAPAERVMAPAAAAEVPPPAPSNVVVVEPASTPGTSLPGAIPPAPAPDPNAQPQPKLPDPLQAMRDSEARKADYQRRMAEAQAHAQNALTNAETWERNTLAFKNPFLARPQLSPEDSAAIAGMSGAERVHWSEARQAEAQAASNAARKALDDLKANPPLN
jgi:hypothetical protein